MNYLKGVVEIAFIANPTAAVTLVALAILVCGALLFFITKRRESTNNTMRSSGIVRAKRYKPGGLRVSATPNSSLTQEQEVWYLDVDRGNGVETISVSAELWRRKNVGDDMSV